MLAFLKQTLERRYKFLQLKAKSTIRSEPDRMNINMEFWEILKLSFEAESLCRDKNCRKEKKQMVKAIEDKIDILYNVISIETIAKFDDVVALAAIYYNLGLVYSNSKKSYKLQKALRFFEICVKLLQERETDRKAILTCINAFNEIHLVICKLGKDKYSSTSLNSALELYLAYTKEKNYPDPIHIPIIIGIESKEANPRIILEMLHFTTLRDIATQYFLQPGNKHGFVIYMHRLLKEYLSEIISEGRSFREDCLDWIVTLFDITKYFLINNRFVEARNYIATAAYIANKFSEDTLKTITQQNEVSQLRYIYMSDAYDYVCGVNARSWGTYGVSLLRFSLEQFLQNKSKKYETDISVVLIENEPANLLMFSEVKEEMECMTDQITDTCILNLEDAKSVFMKIIKYLETAKAYFTADSDIENYAEITLEISAAFKYLAGFEQRKDCQLKLHKRRVEYLEDVYKKFHLMIDTEAEYQIYKRVWYEVIISSATVMDLILEERVHNLFKTQKMSKEIDLFVKRIVGNVDLYLLNVD